LFEKINGRLIGATTLCGVAISLASVAFADTTPAAPAAPAPAAAPAAAPATPPPAYGKLTVSGLFDGYYQYGFSKGKSAPDLNTGDPGVGGAYNLTQATPSLALAEANLTILPSPGGFGGKATLGAGSTAESVNVVPGGSEARYANFLQLYGTYAFSGAAGGSLDLGKFYTPFGYEVTESNQNFNYTRSTTYQLLPFYHTGLRLTLPSEKGFTLIGFLVNSLEDSAYEGVSNKSGKLAGIGQLTYADPAGKYTIVESYGGGTNKPVNSDVKNTLSDTDFTYSFTSADTLGLNYTYSDSDPTGGNKTVSNGYGIYYKHQLNPINAIALRYDGYTAKTDNVSQQYKPYDITATYEIKSSSQWLTRLEYRYDGANVNTYTDSNGNINKENESLVVASEVYTF